MPYIKPDKRGPLDLAIAQVVYRQEVGNYGDLNYAITKLVDHWCTVFPSYDNFNALIGVLECVKQEFYRRKVVPYEEQKREENGDVYE